MAVAEVREAVRAGGLLAPGEPLVAMLSGGRDSTCLLDVAVALLGRQGVLALHVNYGLRDAAAGEEERCRELCSELGVSLAVRAVEPRAAPPEGNLQAWARELRYSAAAGVLGGRGGSVATGHTAGDQVETILYRLAASPGRRALLGMAPREGALVRPLLAITREQTAEYCRERGLGWSEDESNSDPRFARTRVREGLLPALAAVHPAAAANVARTALLLREETELLEGLVDVELGGRAAISAGRLAELPAGLARLVLIRLAEGASGSYVPQAGEHVAEVLALGRRGGRAEVHLGGQVAAVIEGGEVSVVTLPVRPVRPNRSGRD